MHEVDLMFLGCWGLFGWRALTSDSAGLAIIRPRAGCRLRGGGGGFRPITVMCNIRLINLIVQSVKRKVGSCLKTGQHSIFVIIRKIKRIIYVCWIPYLLEDFIDSMEKCFHF